MCMYARMETSLKVEKSSPPNASLRSIKRPCLFDLAKKYYVAIARMQMALSRGDPAGDDNILANARAASGVVSGSSSFAPKVGSCTLCMAQNFTSFYAIFFDYCMDDYHKQGENVLIAELSAPLY